MLKKYFKKLLCLFSLIILMSYSLSFATEESTDSLVLNEGADSLVIDENTTYNSSNYISDEELEDSVSSITSENELSQYNIKNGDVYICDDDVTIDYIVSGNVFICANNVTIKSQIDGDAFICANTINIEKDAYIFKNLFAVASSINVNGIIYDVYACAKDFNLTDGFIYRDLKVSCENFNMSSAIGRDAFIDCSNMNFDYENSNQTQVNAIGGNLTYTAKSEISIPNSLVTGTTSFNQKITKQKTLSENVSDYLLKILTFVILSLFVWLICLWLMPKFLTNTNKLMGKRTLPSLGYGLLFLLSIPIISIVLLALNVTSSVALVLSIFYIICIIISKPLVSICINNYICKKSNVTKKVGIAGLLIVISIILEVICCLPYIGWVVSLISIILGLGILSYYALSHSKLNAEVLANTKDN